MALKYDSWLSPSSPSFLPPEVGEPGAPGGSVTAGVSLHPGEQPVLPRGLCGGRAGPLHAEVSVSRPAETSHVMQP